jgi:hypothetical protein
MEYKICIEQAFTKFCKENPNDVSLLELAAQDYTAEEISIKLNVLPNTISKRINVIRKKLRPLVDQCNSLTNYY